MNGNLTQKNNSGEITNYQWNGFDKMRKVTLPDNSEISFIYGADGLRRKKVTGSGVVNYLLDGLSVLAEYDDSGNMSVSYIPGMSMTKDGATYYYHYDGLGSVRFISDSTGAIVQEYSYDAWGNLTSSTSSLSQPYQYVGEQFYYSEPSLNLQLLGQRWYDGETGRFISRDPIPDNNLYVYVKSNPVNLIDSTGFKVKHFSTVLPISNSNISLPPWINRIYRYHTIIACTACAGCTIGTLIGCVGSPDYLECLQTMITTYWNETFEKVECPSIGRRIHSAACISSCLMCIPEIFDILGRRNFPF